MISPKISKKIISIILISTTLCQTNPIHCETQVKPSKSTSILGTLLGIGGIAVTYLTVALIHKSYESHKKQNEIQELKKKIEEFKLKTITLEQKHKSFEETVNHNTEKLNEELEIAKTANDELHQTWYTTYYCATMGLIDEHRDWMKIAEKCTTLAVDHPKIHENIDNLFAYSRNQNISKRDFIFNVLAATYLSKYLPIGSQGIEIPTVFSPTHWLYCCDIKTSDDHQEKLKTFDTCKNLTLNLFTDTMNYFDPSNPQENHLRNLLKLEFIDVLAAIQ